MSAKEIDWGNSADVIADAPDDGASHANQSGADEVHGLDADALEDAPAVAAEGQRLLTSGVEYVVDGIIPAYGVLGMDVAYAKVGKTSFGMALSGKVATGARFLDRQHRAEVFSCN